MDQKQIYDIIKACNIFSKLDDAEIIQLAKLVQIIELAPGSTLCHQGDMSRDAYIVAAGKLVASTLSKDKEKVVGNIIAGEIVGEMSLLSKQPRSLTITAKTYAVLLMIPYTDFYYFWHESPSVLQKMVEVVVSRTHELITLLEKPKRYKYIGILPANEKVNISQFIKKIKRSLVPDGDVLVIDNADFDNADSAIKLLNSYEDKSNYIVYPITNNKPQTLAKLTQYAEKLIVIGEAGSSQKLSSNTLELLHTTQATSHENPDLVLLYKKLDQIPHDTKSWLQQADFFRHHHIYLNKPTDFQRLIRFINGTATGLVLSGGGSKGWAEVGAIKAILEANIPIDAIGGVSSGSVIAGIFALATDYNQFLSDCDYISKKTMKSISLFKLVLPVISILSANPGTAALQEKFGQQQIEDLPLPYFCVSYNITTDEEVIHDRGLLWQAARASSSIPGILPPVVIDGNLHIDGGVSNNLPVNVMRELLGNSGKIIAIALSPCQTRPPGDYNFPPTLSLWETILIKCRLRPKYKIPNFLNTFIYSLLAGATQMHKSNCVAADILIIPPVEQYPILHKKRADYKKITDLGYKAAKQALKNHKND